MPRACKVVLANGVFDVLHWGHLRHLQAARKMGTRLVVSVTADRFVNKGPGRPVFNQVQRARMLRALRCVDQVIGVPGLLDALRRVKPDILVKGAEYRGKLEKIHRDYCRDHGIKIRFTTGSAYSTTKLLSHYGPRAR